MDARTPVLVPWAGSADHQPAIASYERFGPARAGLTLAQDGSSLRNCFDGCPRDRQVTDVPTGLADEHEYFALVRRDLEDALGAKATLIAQPQATTYRRPGPQRVRLRLPGATHLVELSRRAPAFSGDEALFVSSYADALEEFGYVPSVFATTASEDVLTRAIAVRCAQGGLQPITVESVMRAIMRHAARTYEGTRVAVNICLDINEPNTATPLTDFLQQPWAPIFGSGLGSAVLLGSDGSASRVIELPGVEAADVLAPEMFAGVAQWTNAQGRIRLSITRAGEIYLFGRGQLLLARRNSQWRGFPIDALLASGWFGTTGRHLGPGVKGALLTSLLDASAAHHGACLGILYNANSEQAVRNLVDPGDRWDAPGNHRTTMFNDGNFLALSRRHRLEMLSMDGATLLNQGGTILAAGAILRVQGGSPGGGRTAAARAIARHGIGIKISQDGPVKAFVQVDDQLFEQFSMG